MASATAKVTHTTQRMSTEKTGSVRTPARRVNHSSNEQKRRRNLRDSMDDLRLFIPGLESDPRESSVHILRGAASYIRSLTRHSTALEAKARELREQNHAMRCRVEELRRLKAQQAGSRIPNVSPPPYGESTGRAPPKYPGSSDAPVRQNAAIPSVPPPQYAEALSQRKQSMRVPAILRARHGDVTDSDREEGESELDEDGPTRVPLRVHHHHQQQRTQSRPDAHLRRSPQPTARGRRAGVPSATDLLPPPPLYGDRQPMPLGMGVARAITIDDDDGEGSGSDYQGEAGDGAEDDESGTPPPPRDQRHARPPTLPMYSVSAPPPHYDPRMHSGGHDSPWDDVSFLNPHMQRRHVMHPQSLGRPGAAPPPPYHGDSHQQPPWYSVHGADRRHRIAHHPYRQTPTRTHTTTHAPQSASLYDPIQQRPGAGGAHNSAHGAGRVMGLPPPPAYGSARLPPPPSLPAYGSSAPRLPAYGHGDYNMPPMAPPPYARWHHGEQDAPHDSGTDDTGSGDG